jgi:hypothetical protein
MVRASASMSVRAAFTWGGIMTVGVTVTGVTAKSAAIAGA